ncbi:MAG: class I SAM-dependent methyltransferase [bacterium]|nr:class I SAM-dependent methyltransferase [bacterium]
MHRVPEPEIMADETEAASYASAAALGYLGNIDASFVAQFLRLGLTRGTVLDIGTGPGLIPLKILEQCPTLRFVATDLSDAMLALAQQNADAHPHGAAVQVEKADAKQLPYANASFDAVISNSVLHHLPDPAAYLREIARVVKPDGVVLVRDIRRPAGWLLPWWWRWFGRHYRGQMLQSYQDSLRAAYTKAELARLLAQSPLRACGVFAWRLTHIGIRRGFSRAGRNN